MISEDNGNNFMLGAMQAALHHARLLEKNLATLGVILPGKPLGLIHGAIFCAIVESGVQVCTLAPRAGKKRMADIAQITTSDIHEWAKTHFGATTFKPKGGN